MEDVIEEQNNTGLNVLEHEVEGEEIENQEVFLYLEDNNQDTEAQILIPTKALTPVDTIDEAATNAGTLNVSSSGLEESHTLTDDSQTKFSNESDSNVIESSLFDESVAQKYLTDSNEAQEFFVLNQDTGQYQKYVYIPPSGLENSNQCHELEATVDVEELEIKDRLTSPSSEIDGNTIILGEKTKVPSTKYKNRKNEKRY
jgi:hypothetical protein